LLYIIKARLKYKQILKELVMSEKINLSEILKKCPEGTKLYSPIFGDCTLKTVGDHLITVVRDKVLERNFYSDGSFCVNGECLLFPSKDQRDWSEFQTPFEDGDVISNGAFIAIFHKVDNGHMYYHCRYNPKYNEFKAKIDFGIGFVGEYKHASKEEKQKLFDVIEAYRYKWNNQTKTLEKLIAPWTIKNAKDGDVIWCDDGWTCIFKNIHGIWFSSYCFITDEGEFHTGYERHAVDSTVNGNAHRATKEQCDRLFQKIKEAGYKWNPETKTLEKINPKFKVGNRVKKHKDYISGIITNISDDGEYKVEYQGGGVSYINLAYQDEWELDLSKFDINTLEPFESRVLVRDRDNDEWRGQFFSHYNNCSDRPYICIGNEGLAEYKQCIPYKGNKHLLGKTDSCDEFYKIW
jgi:hypothetical protein